jgi:hypothetical protein
MSAFARLLTLLLLLPLLQACGGGADLVAAGGGVTVTIDTASAVLPPGGTFLFSAKVTGSTNRTVTWSAIGGNGSFTGVTGLYTAPSTTGEYRILATSNADPTKVALATVLVPTPLAVIVSPKTVALKPGESRMFTAAINGSASQAVTWSTIGTGSGTFTGTSGLYTAPSTYGIFTVVATSIADPSRSDTASVNVGDTVRVSVSPGSTSILPGGSAIFTATVTGTADTSVDWSISQPSEGCLIDTTGKFSAGTVPGTYVVKATARANPLIFGTAQVTLSNVTLALDIRVATLDQGESKIFTPTLTGTSNQQVDWKQLGSTAAAVRQTGPYAFVAQAAAGTFLLQAASVANPLAQDLATITVRPVVVTLQPSQGVVLLAGGTAAFTAQVQGTRTPGVTWDVMTGGAGGSINGAGVYTAAIIPGSDTVTATSIADPTVIASAVVTVGRIDITPLLTIAQNPGQTTIFRAVVAGVPDPGVTWSVRVGASVVDPSPISPTGLFTAPTVLGDYRIRATSVYNLALFSEVQIQVVAP